MPRTFPYSTTEEFLENEFPRRIIGGIKCYTIKQISKATGVHRRTVVSWMEKGLLKKLGIDSIKDPFSGFNYFTEDQIKSLYKNYITKCLNGEFK